MLTRKRAAAKMRVAGARSVEGKRETAANIVDKVKTRE
jgi:hypothetical protein